MDNSTYVELKNSKKKTFKNKSKYYRQKHCDADS